MVGTRLLLGFGAWLALMLLAAGEKLETVAYVVDRAGFDSLGSQWHWRNDDNWDPFGEDAEPGEKFVEPVRLEKKPNGTRFFADGDRMWLLTGTFLQQKVLQDERSWAVWNEDRNRLVVHGTRREHGWVAILWSDFHHVRQVATSVQLVKVRCRELEGVEWTPEEVRKRGGVVQHEVAVTTRPGGTGSTVMPTEVGEVKLEVEANPSDELRQVDLRLSYSAAVGHPEGVRNLTLGTGIAIYGGHRVYIEVGGADGAGETWLLGVMSETQFMDRTPRWQWREFEDESVREEPWADWGGESNMQRLVMDDGKVFVRAKVDPSFPESLLPAPGGGEIDPFAVTDNETRMKRYKEAGIQPMEKLPDVLGYRKTDVLLDLSPVCKDMGLALPKGTWVCFNQTRAVVMAMMTPVDADLFDALMTSCLHCGLPRMLRVTASLIEWEGELQPGRIPAGARRLARMGGVARTGQVASMSHCDSDEALKRGVSLEVEANAGPNGRIWDIRLLLEAAGERRARLVTSLTVVQGDPVVVPVGEEDGKKLGVLVECQIVDGTGREWGR